MSKISNIIFDLGGVLIDWNPEYLYKDLIPDPDRRVWFLQNVCTMDWNVQQDAGRSWSTAILELQKRFPEWEIEIASYFERWVEMLNGPIQETVEILRHFKKSPDYEIYALTNWSAETFPYALERYDFLSWFKGIVVSGIEKTRKPFPDIYNILLERYNLSPESCLFIDDNLDNIEAAQRLGIFAHHFTSPARLIEELSQLDIIK
ncbi:MAG: HAD family phosphatase [Saprospiraceae bacterium]|nr:HAD family phosphatase [Saprospiraceae bacterium]